MCKQLVFKNHFTNDFVFIKCRYLMSFLIRVLSLISSHFGRINGTKVVFGQHLGAQRLSDVRLLGGISVLAQVWQVDQVFGILVQQENVAIDVTV